MAEGTGSSYKLVTERDVSVMSTARTGDVCFVPGGVGAQLCRHINVIKNSHFVVYSKFGIWTTSVFGGSIMWISSYTCYLFSG